ncbi:pyridoxamine 5'-phosphate oxidase family protein [Yoonia sp. F2084L]|uniref:pyridoxamine 5'-phosphate oxidase family protein n=1 Tax=Yoonia sp. F2084L TaxID=2926419 RepID=UPI001FF2A543|nr:pyridoxamine 5'-phosphate oxidase family protein [Yoonia sp. F2084L]MCK0096131.1 pyridoxamine 5'-phosphate oxidase family protein [Yoonia sp. F2084L]
MLTAPMKDLIATFPLGFVASVTSAGAPAVSPKGTFIVLDDRTVAYGDIRSPGTRRNLMANPAVEVNFVDPFKRKAVRVSGTTTVHMKASDRFVQLHPQWLDVFGALAQRMTALIEIDITAASEIWTPPYDDGATEDDMIAIYKDKFGAIYP